MRMEVNDREMLNVRRIIKPPLVYVRYPVVQFGAEAATVNCYLTLLCDEIRQPSVIPVEISWDIKPSDCIYMTLTHVKYGHRNSLQTFNHHVIMYLNSGVVKTSVLSDRYSAKKIQCMLDKLKMRIDCDISELASSEILNNVQRDLGLQFGILVNERVIYLYYKMVDYLYKK